MCLWNDAFLGFPLEVSGEETPKLKRMVFVYMYHTQTLLKLYKYMYICCKHAIHSITASQYGYILAVKPHFLCKCLNDRGYKLFQGPKTAH